jgi:hypothetical protein
MPNGFGGARGMGRGFRGGMGFGFRGSSPPWPYVGIGRGGLPRCGYFISGAAGVPAAWPNQLAPYPYTQGFGAEQGAYPPYAAVSPTFGSAPFTPQITPEQEIDFLKNQAEALKGQLEQIEARMRELEGEE